MHALREIVNRVALYGCGAQPEPCPPVSRFLAADLSIK